MYAIESIELLFEYDKSSQQIANMRCSDGVVGYHASLTH